MERKEKAPCSRPAPSVNPSICQQGKCPFPVGNDRATEPRTTHERDKFHRAACASVRTLHRRCPTARKKGQPAADCGAEDNRTEQQDGTISRPFPRARAPVRQKSLDSKKSFGACRSPCVPSVVGVRGFEPPTSSSRTRRANQTALHPGRNENFTTFADFRQ